MLFIIYFWGSQVMVNHHWAPYWLLCRTCQVCIAQFIFIVNLFYRSNGVACVTVTVCIMQPYKRTVACIVLLTLPLHLHILVDLQFCWKIRSLTQKYYWRMLILHLFSFSVFWTYDKLLLGGLRKPNNCESLVVVATFTLKFFLRILWIRRNTTGIFSKYKI